MAYSGANIPCPCGSGKALKDCCFAESLSFLKDEFLNRASNQEQPLTKDTLNRIAREVAQKTMAQNAKPIDDFAGLSPDAMHQILYYPLESESTARINPNTLGYAKSPIYGLFTLLVNELRGSGIKTTAKGNLSRNSCRHIAEQYFTKDEYEELTHYKGIQSEEDFRKLFVLRYVCGAAGFIRKYKGRFVLAKKCQKLLSKGKGAEIYLELFRAYCTKFNWTYGDGCYEHQFFQQSFMFTLYLLQKFGGEKLDSNFYGEKFIRAFPQLKQELITATNPYDYEREERYIRLCLRLRVIERFAQFFGFVEIEEVGKDILKKKHMVKKTPLLDEMFSFNV